MLKKLLSVLLCLLLLNAVLPAAAEDETSSIWIATDIHYLSPSLTDYGSVFQKTALASGNKLIERSGELLEAFLQKALEGGADIVVLTGDLTFDGEMASLLDIIDMVQSYKEKGLTVLMLPGNHDIGTGRSCDYFDATGSNRVPGISQQEFQDLCTPYGRDRAITADPNSYSFVYPLTGKTWLMLLDCNTDIAHNGRFVHRTFGWMQTAFDMARQQGAEVLCFSHQNLLPIDVMAYNSFNVENWPELLNLLEDNGVKYNFSGHSHMQHTATWRTGLTEYVTASLCIYPLQYAVVTVGSGEPVYQTCTMDLYQEEAEERLRTPMLAGLKNNLLALGVSDEDSDVLASYAVDVNAACIAGDEAWLDALRQSDIWALWREKGQKTFWYAFMNSILEGEE